MRILQATTGFPPDREGGIENYVYILRQELLRKGHEVKVLTRLWKRAVRVNNVIQLSTPLGELSGYITWLIKAYIQIIRDHSYDILHCHGLEGHILCSLSSIKIPKVLHMHNSLLREPGYYEYWRHHLALLVQKKAWQNATAIISPTHVVKMDFLKYIKSISPDKIRVIPNMINTEEFNPSIDGQDVKTRYGIEDKIVILYLGKIKPTKGIEDICKALKFIRAKRHDVVLMVAGSPTATTRFYDYLRFNYPETIFTGYIDKPVKYYASSDIFCIYTPGFAGGETFAIALAEAMAMGLPIVCSDNPIFQEVMRGNAIFAQPNNPQKLGEALLYLIDNPNVRRAMGRKSREIAENFYNCKKVVSQIEKLYESIL